MTPADLAKLISDQSIKTIDLPDGDYGDLKLASRKGLSVKGGRGAVFRTLSVVGCEGIELSGFTVAYLPDGRTTNTSDVCRLYASTSVSLTDLAFVGSRVAAGTPSALLPTDPAAGQNAYVVGYYAARALTMDRCQKVTVSRCDIGGFFKGLNISNARDVVVVGNDIHDLRTTPISGGSLTNVAIEKNHLHGSHPYRYANDTLGDHSDAIHLITAAGKGPNANIRIADNIIDMSEGYAPLGINLGDNGLQGFRSVVIDGNLIILGNTQGITMSPDVEVVISDNVLLAPVGALNSPTVVIRGTKVTLVGNTLADVTGSMAKVNPDNRWLKPGAQTAAVLDAARKVAMAKLSAVPVVEVDPRDLRLAALQVAMGNVRVLALALKAKKGGPVKADMDQIVALVS